MLYSNGWLLRIRMHSFVFVQLVLNIPADVDSSRLVIVACIRFNVITYAHDLSEYILYNVSFLFCLIF